VCTGGDQAPGSVSEALGMMGAGLDYLNGPAGQDLDTAALGGVLETLAGIGSKYAAARIAVLSRFDAHDCHDADGYATSAAWLAGRAKTERKAARAQVKQMRQLNAHPVLAGAMAAGIISESWAGDVASRTGELPAPVREETDQILLDAAAAGADLDDLKILASAAREKWLSQQPSPDDPDDGFGDRSLHLGTTLDGAGRISGNLTPEAAAAVQAVLEALGKKRGREDTRTAAQRFHDALQEGCELLIRAKMVPDRAGADSRVEAVIAFSQLRDLPGAPVLEEAWLAARAGEHGYLAGEDAEVIACDALIVPVVTGGADWAVIAQMIRLVLDALAAHGPARDTDTAPGTDPDTDTAPGTDTGTDTDTGTAGQPGTDPAGQPGNRPAGPPAPLPPEAWEALQYALAKLAIDFVSGPGAIASLLRTSLLAPPFSTKSVPLDVGYSGKIPEAIRRAVILRDKHCAWPGCDKRPAACDVHHIKHKKDGGPTSVNDCILMCQYHHDICIHRWGWQIELLPGGEVRAYGPGGQILRSHSPPAQAA
jgi:hypothetical protein